MRGLLGAALVTGILACAPGSLDSARAEIVIAIDKSKQRMAVLVDGQQQHVWKVSTGTGGGPRAGTYQPQRLEKSWFSRKYGMSPMPHSIFFHEGYAIHGTIYVSRLGNRASHGCVRLHPDNAKALFELVRRHGTASTVITVSNTEFAIPAKPPAPAAPGTVVELPHKSKSRPEPIKVNAPAEIAPKAQVTPVVLTPVRTPARAVGRSETAQASVAPPAAVPLAAAPSAGQMPSSELAPAAVSLPQSSKE